MSVTHDFVPELQPTNVSCTQTSTAMLLSHYDKSFTAAKVLEESPTAKLPGGGDAGSSMQQLAVYCLDQGYKGEMYSFDSRILDLSWATLPNNELIEKLQKVKSSRDIESLGKKFTSLYIEQYIEFIQKGGSLLIKPYPTRELLSELVQQGPLCVGLNYATFTNSGHGKDVSLRTTIQDDAADGIATHAVLVYGQDDDGNFLVSDPWGDPQQNVATPDQLIASIMAAQWLCDDVFFRIIG